MLHFALCTYRQYSPQQMPESIGNYSPEGVIDAIEGNLVDAAVAMGRTEDGVVFRGSDVSWVYTGFPTLNRIMRARFTDEQAEDRVAEIAECFRQWNAPVVWIMGPSTWPPHLPDYLQDSGFSHTETWMGVAADLGIMPVIPPGKDLRIELVTEAEPLKIWAQLSAEHWPADSTGAASIFSPQSAGSDPRCRYYLGYLNNKPVVRGMACVKGDTAGLYWISSPPEHRGVGFDLAVAGRALSDAKEGGAKLAVMPIRDSHSPLCQKLGFKPYCQFSVYGWPSSPAKIQVC
jgi:hypothetical protein